MLGMSQITLYLPDGLSAELDEASREANSRPEDVAREMVERALRVRRFDRVRRKIIDSLGPDAPQSDQDAFEQVS